MDARMGAASAVMEEAARETRTGGGSSAAPQPRYGDLKDVPVTLIGQAGAWFGLEKNGDEVAVRPREALSRRCTIRVAAQFEHDQGYFSASPVMGRLDFPKGTTEVKTYRPFTLDPRRTLRELYFPVEAMPDDEWQSSAPRWQNFQAVAKRLLGRAEIAWNGLSRDEVDILLLQLPYMEIVEACVLHALARWSAEAGECVVEIGSFQGFSTSVMALGLRAAASEAPLISIDPHVDHPCHGDRVRLAMRQAGEEGRLVQFACGSDRAAGLLRPGCASMVFVDGDHSFEQVLRDFENYREFVAPGGVMAFHDHDFSEHNGQAALHPGVRRVVEEHVLREGTFRPVLLAHTLFAFVRRV